MNGNDNMQSSAIGYSSLFIIDPEKSVDAEINCQLNLGFVWMTK